MQKEQQFEWWQVSMQFRYILAYWAALGLLTAYHTGSREAALVMYWFLRKR